MMFRKSLGLSIHLLVIRPVEKQFAVLLETSEESLARSPAYVP